MCICKKTFCQGKIDYCHLRIKNGLFLEDLKFKSALPERHWAPYGWLQDRLIRTCVRDNVTDIGEPKECLII